MSLKNLMFHWYCLEGKCASFILGHNEYYVFAGRGHCMCFMLKVMWVIQN